MEEFIKKLNALFNDVVITEQTVLNELPDFDSLDILAIIYMINEEYNVSIDVNELLDHIIVEDLYIFITDK